MRTTLTVGSRKSPLAMRQAQWVIGQLTHWYPGVTIELKTYITKGDQQLDKAISQLNDKGLFVKELEIALLNGEIDMAVHSMKDMPSDLPDGLYLTSFGVRESALDAFISQSGRPFMELTAGSDVGTSSLRRQAFLRRLRTDLHYTVIRGNIDTRLTKMHEGKVDALVLAHAGLRRLGMDRLIVHTFSRDQMLPACCQGILGVEYADPEVALMLTPFVDPDTQVAFTAERAFLKTLQAGCQVPAAAYVTRSPDIYTLDSVVMDMSGRATLLNQQLFKAHEAEQAGARAAQVLIAKGASDIIHVCQVGDSYLNKFDEHH